MSKGQISAIPQTFWAKQGVAAARPVAGTLRNGSLWYSTDTKDICQVESGAWVTIFDYSLTVSAVNVHAAISDAHHTPASKYLTVAEFQHIPAFGDFASNPQNINNNAVGTAAGANNINQYAEVTFSCPTKITQWRQFGNDQNTGDGRWKLQYLNVSNVWTDWQTAIPVRTTEDWSNWDSSAGEVVALGFRIVCTTVDTNTFSNIEELEVKY